MKYKPQNPAPVNADELRKIAPTVCYPIDTLPKPDMALYTKTRQTMTLIDEVIVPPRDGRCFHVPAGPFFRVVSVEGP